MTACPLHLAFLAFAKFRKHLCQAANNMLGKVGGRANRGLAADLGGNDALLGLPIDERHSRVCELRWSQAFLLLSLPMNY